MHHVASKCNQVTMLAVMYHEEQASSIKSRTIFQCGTTVRTIISHQHHVSSSKNVVTIIWNEEQAFYSKSHEYSSVEVFHAHEDLHESQSHKQNAVAFM